MAEEVKLRVAKATPEDVDQMREFLFVLEEKVNDPNVDLYEIGLFCHARFNSDCGRHFQRVWKPEVKEDLTVANNASTRPASSVGTDGESDESAGG